MQREILFRGIRVGNGEWVYGGYWKNRTATRETVYISDKDGCSRKVDPATVGQYTEITDKNGVKAFAGDAFHKIYSENWEDTFTIEWDEKLLAWVANNGISEPELLCDVWDDTCVVISDIHDKEET